MRSLGTTWHSCRTMYETSLLPKLECRLEVDFKAIRRYD